VSSRHARRYLWESIYKIGDTVTHPPGATTLHTSLLITDLELYGYHGYFDEEQRLGQKFLFNVLANLAPAETHLADSFEASVRYDQLIEEVERISNQAKFRTLEALGETIARGLVKRFDRITSIAVTVSKASPPISQSLERVSVKIQLDR
jgi:7,8-dihydroneopterin aldolase/epimerase/oxygenase